MQEARRVYNDRKTLEDAHQSIPSDFHSWLFMERKFVEKYGVCPEIKPLEIDDAAVRNWLKNSGAEKDYQDLYEKYISKTKLEEYISEKEKVLEGIQERFKDHPEFFEKVGIYKETNTRTKASKEMRKEVIIYYQKYLEKEGVNLLAIFLGDPPSDVVSKRFVKLNSETAILKKNNFNTEKVLRKELYDYLENYRPEKFTQTKPFPGTPYKALNTEQQLDRKNSFIRCYVRNMLVHTGLVHDEPAALAQFEELYPGALSKNEIVYSVKTGCINKVKTLKFDGVSCKLSRTCLKEDLQERGPVKRSIAKSVISKETEKAVNETILECVLKNEPVEINTIKEKVGMKRITKADKQKINEIYDDIAAIVTNNPI